MADLRTNRPDGVCRLTGIEWLEDSGAPIRLQVTEDGVPHSWTGWTVDYAQITTADGKTGLVSLAVAFEADGWVRIDPNLAQLTQSLAPIALYPNGRPALLTVRLKDPQTWPVYLVRPSLITIAQGPGANT